MVIPSQDNIPGPQNISEAKPLQIELDDISVESDFRKISRNQDCF